METERGEEEGGGRDMEVREICLGRGGWIAMEVREIDGGIVRRKRIERDGGRGGRKRLEIER